MLKRVQMKKNIIQLENMLRYFYMIVVINHIFVQDIYFNLNANLCVYIIYNPAMFKWNQFKLDIPCIFYNL